MAFEAFRVGSRPFAHTGDARRFKTPTRLTNGGGEVAEVAHRISRFRPVSRGADEAFLGFASKVGVPIALEKRRVHGAECVEDVWIVRMDLTQLLPVVLCLIQASEPS